VRESESAIVLIIMRERESAIVLIIMRERECNSSNNEREKVQ
jgi:hypothetical protein